MIGGMGKPSVVCTKQFNHTERTLTYVHVCVSDRLVLSIADPPGEQVNKLRAQDEAVEGERSETLLHSPLLTGRLIWVQIGVGCMPACKQQQNKSHRRPGSVL